MINEVLHVYDDFRLKYVQLTPEEWVRQHFAHYLVDVLHYPKTRLMMEYGIKYLQRQKRPDIGLVDAEGNLSMLVECKAPRVALTEAVFLQIATYHSVKQAKILVLTNGLNHVYARVQPNDPRIVYIEELPSYR